MQTIPAKTILTRSKNTSWFGSEYNMNLYRGCCHGCLYCDSRSDCYQNPDFDTVKVKADALRILRDNLASKVKKGVVATGAMSDPYNPFERQQLVTRHSLQLLDAYGFGVAIATKGDLITRDTDLLADISMHSPVICKITITTTDSQLAAKIEPHAPSPASRLAAIEKLAAAGIFTGVLLMPVLPFLQDTDESVLAVVEHAYQAGARFIFPAFGVTMRAGQREYFLNKLDEAFPGEELGQRYRKTYGERYHCSSPRARHLWRLFCDACKQRGLLYEMQEIVRASRTGCKTGQLFFEGWQ